MATFYIDPDTGNDASAGTTPGTAWRTVTNGATAPRIAPGDVIRIKKSPDPTNTGINATWTNKSASVILASALTTTVSLCETAWTSDNANVTTSASSTRKQGSFSSRMQINLSSVTGLIAHETIASTDFSGSQQLSFHFRSDIVSLPASSVRVDLCSDTLGATAVDSFTIPFSPQAFRWYTVTIDKGLALGASIQSVAVRLLIAPGATGAIYLDDIQACKAKSQPDSLTLNSLISKGGSEGYWAIQSINGTTVLLEANAEASPTDTNRGYYGTSANVPLFKREPFVLYTPATNINEFTDNGTLASPITYAGGWDGTFTVQDGITYYDAANNNQAVWNASSTGHINISRLGAVRGGAGFQFNAPANATYTITDCYTAACASSAFNMNGGSTGKLTLAGTVRMSGGYRGITSTFGNLTNNATCLIESGAFIGIDLAGATYNTGTGTITVNNQQQTGFSCTGALDIGVLSTNDCFTTGTSFSSNQGPILVKQLTSTNNGTGVDFASASDVTVLQLSTSGNTAASAQFNAGAQGVINLHEWTRTEATGTMFNAILTTFYKRFRLHSHNEGGVAGTHVIRMPGGTISSDAANGHAPATVGWKYSPINTVVNGTYTISHPLVEAAVNSGSPITISIYCKRSSSTEIGARVRVIGSSLPGVGATDLVSSATAASGVWEQLSVTFTPSVNGVVQLLCEAWITGTSLTDSAWFSDAGVV